MGVSTTPSLVCYGLPSHTQSALAGRVDNSDGTSTLDTSHYTTIVGTCTTIIGTSNLYTTISTFDLPQRRPVFLVPGWLLGIDCTYRQAISVH